MRILNETYLDQMCEELEILDFELDRLWEAATGTSANESYNEDSLDGISLLEDVEPEIQILNEEAYDLYVESLTDSLKKIWSAIVRFVKSIFTSTGKTLTTSDIQKTVEIISSASAEGVEKGSVKKVIQNGFYIIAGLGTSVDGIKLREAYESGDIMNFVYQNITKVKIGSLPEGARFRICIGSYSEASKVNTGIIEATFRTLIKGGLAAVINMAKAGGRAIKKGIKDTKKSYRKFEKDFHIESVYGDDEDSYFEDYEDYSDDEYLTEGKGKRNRQNRVNSQNVGQTTPKEPTALTVYTPPAKPKTPYTPSEAETIAYEAGRKGGRAKAVEEYEKQLDEREKTHKTQMKDMQSSYEKQLSEKDKRIADQMIEIISANAAYEDLDKKTQIALAAAANQHKIDIEQLKKANTQQLRQLRKQLEDQHIAEVMELTRKNENALDKQYHDMMNYAKKKNRQGMAIGAGGAALAMGLVAIVDHGIKKIQHGNELLSLATITYVNESQPNAIAKIRLYTRNSVTNLDVSGRDKVYALRDDLTSIAKEMEMGGDKLSPGMKEKVREFAMNINMFFAGMIEKPSKS